MTGKVEASITAQNTGTEAIVSNANKLIAMVDFDSNTLVGTVHLQKRFTSTGSWIDIESYTAQSNKVINEVEADTEYRLFCKTGNYTSGTGYLRISY